MRRDLAGLSEELTGQSAILAALMVQLQNKGTERLTDKALGAALFSIAATLERIAEDIDEIDNARAQEEPSA